MREWLDGGAGDLVGRCFLVDIAASVDDRNGG
jgi:hypothetical protein